MMCFRPGEYVLTGAERVGGEETVGHGHEEIPTPNEQISNKSRKPGLRFRLRFVIGC
jgi:hypothetical protein